MGLVDGGYWKVLMLDNSVLSIIKYFSGDIYYIDNRGNMRKDNDDYIYRHILQADDDDGFSPNYAEEITKDEFVKFAGELGYAGEL